MTIESTELQNSTETAIGYIPCYRLPFLSLFHADCMEIMKQYPDKYFDLAIVDPPYGFRTEKTGILNFRKGKQEKEWNVAPTAEYFDELKRVSKNQIVWGGNYFPELWVNGCRCFIYWHKGNPVPNFADGELAWTSFDRNAKQCDYRYYGNLEGKSSAGDKFHPTQKPVYLYDWIFMNYAKDGDKILDTHLGSGSIALAVDKANRLDKMNLHLTACEIDKEYIDKAIKRISESIKQGTLPF
jgi:site-specific DNA-methyltransferase (adenine-specific)